MYRTLLSCISTLLMFPACSNHTPGISVVCEENNVGNCIIKWETAPVIEGKIKIYASTDPNSIPEDAPVVMADIHDQKVTIVNSDPSRRYYYLMVFNDRYRVKIASRNINISGVQNFRDLGGYKTNNEQSVRWGMLYRSAQLDSLDDSACRELKNLGIRTIIDFRSKAEIEGRAPLQKNFNVVNIPIYAGDMKHILEGLQNGTLESDTIYKIVMQMNRDLVKNYREEYKKMFEILLDKKSYPVVIHCNWGKDRTGIVSALILTALGVNSQTIMEDYQLSNNYFNITKVTDFAYNLPVNSQEAFTIAFSAQEGFLNAAKEEIEKRYEDIPAYLEKALDLKKEDIERLRNILLESQQ